MANPTTEKASLNSKKSISDCCIPAFERALGSALAGAMVNHSGSKAASAYPLMVAKGLIPSDLALSALIRTNAAAPSLMVEALAAVTVPSFVKAGLRAGILSKNTLLYSSSVSKIMGSPLRWGMDTGIISLENFPASQAALARW